MCSWFYLLRPFIVMRFSLEGHNFSSNPNTALPYPPLPPYLPPGFLHTPDGGHPPPTLSRHSPPVFSAPWAGHWVGSAHPPGAHSHSAGKAMMTSLKGDMHTRSSTNNAISLLPPLSIFFSCVHTSSSPSVPHVVCGSSLFDASYFYILPPHTCLSESWLIRAY